MARADLRYLLFRKDNTRLQAFVRRLLAWYIKRTAPRDQAKKLTPSYPPGCKRIIVDQGYLAALHRPNVTVNWEAINAIVEDGIQMKTGEIIPLDIIIFGTGYSVEPTSLRVRGRKQTLHEYFSSKGGPTAYLGSCFPGFPNAFVVLGPNVASGHASVIFSQETQIDMAMQLIKRIIDGKARAVEVKDDVTDEYNSWLQGRLSQSVWVECNSYYQVGGTKETKIIATFPGPVALFWWLCRRVRSSAFRWT